jgi:hypothetical protein
MRFLGLCPCVNRAEFKSLYSDSQIRWVKAAPAAGARVLTIPVVAEATGVRLGYHWLRFPRHGWRAISPVGSPTRAAVSKGAHIEELESYGLSLRCERASFRCAFHDPRSAPPELHQPVLQDARVSGQGLRYVFWSRQTCFLRPVEFVRVLYVLFVCFLFVAWGFFLCLLFCMFVAVKLLELEVSCVFFSH